MILNFLDPTKKVSNLYMVTSKYVFYFSCLTIALMCVNIDIMITKHIAILFNELLTEVFTTLYFILMVTGCFIVSITLASNLDILFKKIDY